MDDRPPNAVLVTGGRGFIGRHLVRHLRETRPLQIVSADVLPVSSPPAERVIEVELDVRDRRKLRELSDRFRFSTVFDLASITEVGLGKNHYLPNTEMTRTIAEWVLATEPEKYVFFSTQFVFRKEGTLPASDQDYWPIDAYGEAKMHCEQLIRNLLPPDRWLILRPTYIWGEGHTRFRDGFLYRLAKGQLLIPNSDDLLRYYGYVRTVCGQTERLSSFRFAELPSKVYYLSDPPISMKRFCGHFLRALKGGRIWLAPATVIRALGRMGDIARRVHIPFPIWGLQADEMTRSYPVPIGPTLKLVDLSTDYERAAADVVAWALSDPEFSRGVRHTP